MRIVVLPGIWPPDVGGPATHGPELARFLVGRGHSVQVVTMASAPPTELPCPVTTVDRARPFPVRYGELTLRAARAARQADLVYASSTYAAAAVASSASRRPLVAKLVSDPAYERARRWGLFDGTLEDFQHAGGTRLTALKRARTRALARARTLIVPSRYLAEIARGWNLDPKRLHVVPNPAPPARAATATERTGLVFAGRLTRQKAMHVALDALAYVPTTALTIIGDGPDRARLERHAHDAGLNGRVRFVGSLPREEVLDALAGAEAAVLSSDWENFPHAAVEALAVGTPMVATTVGGVGEIVSDGVNGLLVPPGSPEAFGHALQRLLESPELRTRLSDGARDSVLELDADRIYGRIEELLEAACRLTNGAEHAAPTHPHGRPDAIHRCRCPDWLTRKFDALERQLDYRVIASVDERAPGSTTARAIPPARAEPDQAARRRPLLPPAAVPRAPADHRLPPRGDHRREPLLGRGVARRTGDGRVDNGRRSSIEIHGDWRTATRLYGSPSRRVLSPLADAVGRIALRRGDAVRASVQLHGGPRRGSPWASR